MGVTLGGFSCIDPTRLWESARVHGWPIAQWYDLPNRFHCPLGQEPGRGWVLLTGNTVRASIIYSSLYDLTFNIGSQSVTLKNLVVVNAKCVTPGVRGDSDAAYLVEVADRRRLYRDLPIDKAYNVVTSTTTYRTGTVNSATVAAWTWYDMVSDIWSAIGTARLGAFPGLPYTPDGTPQNFAFWCQSAWDALGTVLARIACALKYDPIADTFGIVRLGAADAALTSALTAFENVRVWDSEWIEGTRANLPEKATVCFRKHPVPAGGESPFYTVEKTDPNANPLTGNTEGGSRAILQDDVNALYDGSGNLLNATALDSRATDRAREYYRSLRDAESRFNRVYEGMLGTAGLRPGSQIGETVWQDRGTGYKTEIGRARRPRPPAPPLKDCCCLTVQDDRFCTYLAASMSAGATTLTVGGAAGFPTSGSYKITVDDEVINVTAGAGTTTWTVSRAQDDTTAQPHDAYVLVCRQTAISTTLSGALTAVATTVTVADGSKFPSYGRFFVKVGSEVMLVIAAGGTNSWTLLRGMDGTVAIAHAGGATVRHLTPDLARCVDQMIFEGGFVQPAADDASVAVHHEALQIIKLVGASPDSDGRYDAKLVKYNPVTNVLEDDIQVYAKDANG